VMQRGVTPEFEASLMRWRQKLFDTVTVTLVSLILAGSAFGAALLFFLLEKRVERNIALGVSAIALALAELLLQLKLPSLAGKRPRIDND